MSLFEKVLVKKPKRARFDFTHGNSLSMKFGLLTPTEVRFIIPGDEVAVSMEQLVRLNPMPVPTFVNMKVRHDWFFVPLTMMYSKRCMDWLLGQSSNRNRFRVSTMGAYKDLFTTAASPLLPGSLHDYLGIPTPSDYNQTQATNEINTFVATPSQANYDAIWTALGTAVLNDATLSFTVEPLLAYHYIWRDYYRFTGIQQDGVPLFESWLENHCLNESALTSPLTSSSPIANFILSSYRHKGAGVGTEVWTDYLGAPYYAHLKKDMYTSARYGTKPTVLIPTGASGTIPNLREASAIQKFIDLISVVGQRYWDKVPAIFDVIPDGMKDERVKFLARYQSFVKVGEVITTATTSQANTGDYAGRGLLIDGKYLFRRKFNEHGWLMCITSIVPDVHYAGFNRQFTDVNMLDTPIPQFAQVGDQSILRREMWFDWDGTSNGTVMGDQFRYYAYKSAPSEIHGDFLMRTFRAWTAMGRFSYYNNIIDATRVLPQDWNCVFGFQQGYNPVLFGSMFYVDLTFHEYITRSLPKYINYAL